MKVHLSFKHIFIKCVKICFAGHKNSRGIVKCSKTCFRDYSNSQGIYPSRQLPPEPSNHHSTTDKWTLCELLSTTTTWLHGRGWYLGSLRAITGQVVTSLRSRTPRPLAETNYGGIYELCFTFCTISNRLPLKSSNFSQFLCRTCWELSYIK